MKVDVRPRTLDLGLPPYATDAYDAAHPVWQSEVLASTTWRVDVADAASAGRSAELLTPSRGPRYQEEDAAAEAALRKAGLVDDVTRAD